MERAPREYLLGALRVGGNYMGLNFLPFLWNEPNLEKFKLLLSQWLERRGEPEANAESKRERPRLFTCQECLRPLIQWILVNWTFQKQR